MTLASEIITRAFRENNIVPIVSSPNTNEQTEALSLLNSIILSVVGNQAGQELHDINIGGSYDQSQFCSNWIPENARLMLSLSGARTFNLHPEPYEGQRLAIADVGGNLATYNLVLTGNGRRIEAATSLTLSTNSATRQWLFRADTANWVRVTDLAASDEMPFPEEFDDYFITRLAMRLAPRNSTQVAQETLDALRRAEHQLRARYRRPRPCQDMPRGLLNGQSSAFGLGINDFYAGRTSR